MIPQRTAVAAILAQIHRAGGPAWAIALALEVAFQADRCRNSWPKADDHQRARWFLGLTHWYGLPRDGFAARSFAETRLRELRAEFEAWRLAEWVNACERPGVVWETDPETLVACYRAVDAVVYIRLANTITVSLQAAGAPAVEIWGPVALRATLDALHSGKRGHP